MLKPPGVVTGGHLRSSAQNRSSKRSRWMKWLDEDPKRCFLPKIGGFYPPKWMVKINVYNGKPYEQMGWFGFFFPLFLETSKSWRIHCQDVPRVSFIFLFFFFLCLRAGHARFFYGHLWNRGMWREKLKISKKVKDGGARGPFWSSSKGCLVLSSCQEPQPREPRRGTAERRTAREPRATERGRKRRGLRKLVETIDG